MSKVENKSFRHREPRASNGEWAKPRSVPCHVGDCFVGLSRKSTGSFGALLAMMDVVLGLSEALPQKNISKLRVRRTKHESSSQAL